MELLALQLRRRQGFCQTTIGGLAVVHPRSADGSRERASAFVDDHQLDCGSANINTTEIPHGITPYTPASCSANASMLVLDCSSEYSRRSFKSPLIVRKGLSSFWRMRCGIS